MDLPRPEPLSDQELDALDLFLETSGSDIRSVEMLDGFFAALVVGPELVMPSRYLPYILGDPETRDPVLADAEETQQLLEVLTRHWNDLVCTLLDGEPWGMVVVEDEDSRPGREWGQGFLIGMSIEHEGWRAIVEDDDRAGAVLPIMMLAHEDDPDPALRSPPITPEMRDRILREISAGLVRMYHEFRDRLESPTPRRRPRAPRHPRRPRKRGR
jgi:uncharacterized protein